MAAVQMDKKRAIAQALRPGFFAGGKASIFLLYIILGPAIGGMLTISVLIAMTSATTGLESGYDNFNVPLQMLLSLPMTLLLGALFGYFVGGAQAVMCALLLAAISDQDGRFSYAQVAFASMIVACLSAVFIYVASDGNLGAAMFMVAAGPPTSLILRFLFRKRFAPVRTL